MLHRTLITALVCAALSPAGAPAATLMSGDDALRALYPGCAIDRQTRYLTDAQKAEVRKLTSAPFDTGIVYPYVVTCNGAAAGVAYFDAHRVRTLPEKLMVAVNPDGTLRRIEVLSFDEPKPYLPPPAWYRQLDGKALDDRLRLGGEVRAIAGATLTATATVEAARRVLALHQVLFGKAR